MSYSNWAGNVNFTSASQESPSSVEEVQSIVRRAARDGKRCRVAGSRHSFNRVADVGEGGVWLSLRRMRSLLSVDMVGRAVVQGGATYGEICPLLHARGWALHNMASLPHVTIAGAVSTATHGSGRGNQNLSSSVIAIELVTASGDIVDLARGHPEWDGAVAALGCLGVVTALTLQCEPAYAVKQSVWDAVPIGALAASQGALGAVMGLAHSVSLFTRWEGDAASNAESMLWVKQRSTRPPVVLPLAIAHSGLHAAPKARHPIIALDPTPCTAQLGTAGPWHERLPHFRYDETPSVGDELQSEFFVDFANGAAAMRAVAALSATLDPVLAVSELRCVAADSQWLSPARGRDSLALHFTWRGGMFDAVWHACALVEQALAPLDYRPHLGKVFTRLPHLDANAKRRFEALQRRMGGDVFRNDFCDAYLFGGSGARSVRSRRALHGAPKL